MNWQPIETAPKDKVVLVFGYTDDMNQPLIPRIAYWAAGAWRGQGKNWDPITAVRWMPLPPNPLISDDEHRAIFGEQMRALGLDAALSEEKTPA